MEKYHAHAMFAFKTRKDAVAFRDTVRNQKSFRNGSLSLTAPPGTLLTAHVVGPNRSGVRSDYPYAVATGLRRVLH